MDRRSLQGRRIVVGVGGGIAAYKACELCRELGRAGAEVRVAMTDAATAFVGPMTFQALTGHPVLTHSYDPAQEATFGHLDLARWADVYVVAPATADVIARIRAGMANDAVTASVLAFRGPVVLAPAMNVAMWENAITQQNVAALTQDPRFSRVGPDEGLLACGDVGAGRLLSPGEIVDAVAARLSVAALSRKSVLITAGPTREYLDPVRSLSNPSTGKMGLALAEVAREQGAEVTVILGPSTEPIPQGVFVIRVVSAEDMAREVASRVERMDYFIAAAAVSDYRPAEVSEQKVKKGQGPEALTLVRTPDILAQTAKTIRSQRGLTVLCGFAAETQNVLENARKKLEDKQLDVIVANDVQEPGAGFAEDTNRVHVLVKNEDPVTVQGTKREVARHIWQVLMGLGFKAR